MCIIDLLIFLFWLLFKTRLFAMISFYWWCEIIVLERNSTYTFDWRARSLIATNTQAHCELWWGFWAFDIRRLLLLLTYFRVDDDYCTIVHAICDTRCWWRWYDWRVAFVNLLILLQTTFPHDSIHRLWGFFVVAVVYYYFRSMYTWLSEEQCDCAFSNKIKNKIVNKCQFREMLIWKMINGK